MNKGKKTIIGRRTGRNVTAGKKIRVLEDGFENFSDYWTDSGNEESTLSQLRGGNSTNPKSTVARKKAERLLKSVSPLSPSDHELTKSLLKNLNKNTAARKISPCQNRLTGPVTKAITSSEVKKPDEVDQGGSITEFEAGAEISDVDINNTTGASDDSATPKDVVSDKPEQQEVIKPPLLVEGNAVGSFSHDDSGKLSFPPSAPNSALLNFKAKKRLTYSRGRNSEENILGSEDKSPSEETDLADNKEQDADLNFYAESAKNKTGRLSSVKSVETQEKGDSGTAATVEALSSSNSLTTNKQIIPQNNDPVIYSDNESDSFMVLQTSFLTTRNEQEQEDTELVSPPANMTKVLERSKRMKRRHPSEEQPKASMLPAKTTRRRNKIQDENKKGPAESELTKSRNVARHRSNDNLKPDQAEPKLKQNTRRKTVKSKPSEDVKFQLSFNFSDSDEESVLPTVEQSLPNNNNQKDYDNKRKRLKSMDHIASTSNVTKTNKEAKQDKKIACHSNTDINIDQLHEADENGQVSCSAMRRPPKKGNIKARSLAASSERAQNQAELVKKRRSQNDHPRADRLRTPAVHVNKKGRKRRKSSKQIDSDKHNHLVPESTEACSYEGACNLSTNNNHRLNQQHDSGRSPVAVDWEQEAEQGISSQQVLPKELQEADVYTFDLEDEPVGNNSAGKVKQRTPRRKTTKKKAGVSYSGPLTPDVSPIAPVQNRSLLSNLNVSIEDEPVENQRLTLLKQQNRKRLSMAPSRRSSHIQSGFLKSILKPSHSMTATPASVVHYCEVTASQTPALTQSQGNNKENNRVKIILPEPCPEGLRRSQRTRVRPLDWFRNERIKYARRKSGLVVAGIESPKYEDFVKGMTRKEKLEHLVRKRRQRMRSKIPKTPKNLSVHEPIADDWKTTETSEIPVIDPTTQEEVLIDCVVTKNQHHFCNVFSEPASPDDPLILCKAMVQPAFSLGQLILRPLEEKCTQFLRNDSLVFVVKKGKVAVTIHKTTSVLETDDSFFIPRGNTYSIKNLRKDEAKFWFFQQKG